MKPGNGMGEVPVWPSVSEKTVLADGETCGRSLPLADRCTSPAGFPSAASVGTDGVFAPGGTSGEASDDGFVAESATNCATS